MVSQLFLAKGSKVICAAGSLTNDQETAQDPRALLSLEVEGSYLVQKKHTCAAAACVVHSVTGRELPPAKDLLNFPSESLE